MIRAAGVLRYNLRYLWHIAILAFMLSGSSCTSIHQLGASQKQDKADEKEKNLVLIKKYENVIGSRISMHKSLPLYKSIDGWMGVSYHYGAMSKNGTDCSGFVCNIYREVYHLQLDRSTEDQYKNDIRRIGKRRLKEGDLVFFETIKGNTTSHVGIYLGNHKFIHASVKKGVCIDDMNQKYYVEHYTHAGRVLKMKLKAALMANGV